MKRKISPLNPEQILSDLCSTDDGIRIKAIRNLCPCRIEFEHFARVRDALNQLKKDPNPDVRAAALHVFDDAAREQSDAYPTRRSTVGDAFYATRRASRFPIADEELRDRRNARAGRRQHSRQRT